MLGGGLEREFEEINKALEQHPASMVSPATPSQANQTNDRTHVEVDQQDQGATKGDWFSRELGQMVRARSQLLPSSDQVDRGLRQQEKSLQPVGQQDDPRSALRQCARELEQVASTLEQIEAYENADTVRREAAQLWEKARLK